MDRRQWLGLIGGGGLGFTCFGSESRGDEHVEARDDPKGATTPNAAAHLHFCGIHVAKNNPKFQIITQHFCSGLGDEMHQCLLYDSMEKNAKLLGVEYIVSDRIYRGLPDEEKKYWHPHTYEVLAGGLIAPAMTHDQETAFMKALLTTWGKTWHTWPDPSSPVPMGQPLLMWSLMADDQVDSNVVAQRDKQFNVSAPKIRTERIHEVGFEVPSVPFPKSIEEIGRQWTASGEDKPTKAPK